MQVQTESKPYDTINVTPMLDLAYVLLVVFILMTTASIQGLGITMPKPSNKPATEQHVRQVQHGRDVDVVVELILLLRSGAHGPP